MGTLECAAARRFVVGAGGAAGLRLPKRRVIFLGSSCSSALETYAPGDLAQATFGFHYQGFRALEPKIGDVRKNGVNLSLR